MIKHQFGIFFAGITHFVFDDVFSSQQTQVIETILPTDWILKIPIDNSLFFISALNFLLTLSVLISWLALNYFVMIVNCNLYSKCVRTKTVQTVCEKVNSIFNCSTHFQTLTWKCSGNTIWKSWKTRDGEHKQINFKIKHLKCFEMGFPEIIIIIKDPALLHYRSCRPFSYAMDKNLLCAFI